MFPILDLIKRPMLVHGCLVDVDGCGY